LTTSTLNIVVFEQGTTYLSGANTTLTGGKGPYVLDGSAGGDTLLASKGDAVLIGGNGDTLVAGKGQDTFLFRSDFGGDTIKNFNLHEHTLQFDQGIFKNVHDIWAHTTNTSAGAVISDGHGDTVALLGVSTAQLHSHEHDFILA
jgi:Ca2+-binding RTX toxin-like protein